MISAYRYQPIYLTVVAILTVYYSFILYNKGANKILDRKGSSYFIQIILILLTLFLGLRPAIGVFTDTDTYSFIYRDMQDGIIPNAFIQEDRLFGLLMLVCSKVMSVNLFFLLVEAVYILCMAFACKRIAKKNADIMIVFCIGAFSFYAYAVNGLRNGMALSITLLAITSLIDNNRRDFILFALISIIAVSLHFSCILPILCAFCAKCIKDPKWFYYFWVLSIPISLVAGESIGNFIGSLGFDERLSYLTNEVSGARFSSTGFRWDFLLYSSIPVALGWYLYKKKKVNDKTYNFVIGTYILANAFWVIICRAEYSNRFAYLSWFIYPVVIAYPLLMIPIWKRTQGRKTAIILIAFYAFTYIMS